MAFPTTAVLDDFNRADGAPGTNWDRWFFYDGGIFQITSNQASFGTAKEGGHWKASTFGPDCEVYFDIPTTSTSVFMRIGFRLVDPTNPSTPSGYNVRFFSSGTNTTFRRVDSGTETQLGAAIVDNYASGDSIGVSMIGSTITLYHQSGGSWSQIDTRSDSTYTAAGYLAMLGGNDAVPRFDNFGGGTVVSAVVTSVSPTQAFM